MQKLTPLSLTVLVALFCFALGAPNARAETDFARCVRVLHKQGGMPLTRQGLSASTSDARSSCLSRPSLETLRCQNQLFLFAALPPTEALNACESEKSNPGFGACVVESARQSGNGKRAIDACRRGGSASSGFQIPPAPLGKFEPLPSPANGKKTICTITVNSDNEREIFKELLPSSEFQHVELLGQPEDQSACERARIEQGHSPAGARDQCRARMAREESCIRGRVAQGIRRWDARLQCSERFFVRNDAWLNRACSGQLRCDVVVVSGHFAGTFLGTSGFDVGLESMAARSCGKTVAPCPNLFDSAKEVHLFGCNTLAERGPDRGRTPRAYRQVLLEDGLDAATAQRIAAQRFTDYGPTFRQQMRWLFPNARRIVGYPAGGPTGANVAPSLRSYLRKVRGTYARELDQPSSAFLDSAVSSTLGKTGALRATGLNGGGREAYCARVDDLARLPSDGAEARRALKSYVTRWSRDLPAAAWQLTKAAERSGSLTPQEARAERARIVSLSPDRRSLCAVTLDEGADALKPYLRGKNLRCDQGDWMRP